MPSTTPPPPPPLLFLLFFLTATTTATMVVGILHPVDFLALQDLHRSLTDLPGSRFLSFWDFTSDPCDFPGVSCSGDRVVSLSLGDPRAGSPGLSGRLPGSLGHLSSLRELSVLPGRVYGPLPTSLSLLRSLRFLALPHNRLSGPIPPSLFSSLRRLRTLDLSSNILSGHIPHSLASLPSLSHLVLCHNHLTGHIPPFRSRSLRHLDLKRNDLRGRIPRLPTSLRYLSLSSNRLSGQMGPSIAPLHRLTYLDLSRNLLSGKIPGVVFSFPLSSLQLQRNELSGAVRPGGRVAIGVVDLSHNRLTGMVSPLLAGVRRLYLNDNGFSGEAPKGLVEGLVGERGGMEVLYLQRNYLTGVEMGPTAEIPASRSFCVQYNCMVPPPAQDKACPVRAGRRRERPEGECAWLRGKENGKAR